MFELYWWQHGNIKEAKAHQSQGYALQRDFGTILILIYTSAYIRS